MSVKACFGTFCILSDFRIMEKLRVSFLAEGEVLSGLCVKKELSVEVEGADMHCRLVVEVWATRLSRPYWTNQDCPRFVFYYFLQHPVNYAERWINVK